MLFERSEFIECFEKSWFRPPSSGRFRTFLCFVSFSDERNESPLQGKTLHKKISFGCFFWWIGKETVPLQTECVSMLVMNEQQERKNPFFLPYDTPHDVAPFDRIRLEDFEEAMLEGIRRDDEQIDKIINNPDKPTFDNTIINVDDEKDGEHYYDLLGRVSTVFFNLLSAETNDEMDALAQKMSPILTKHANDIRLNEKLFERIQYVHRHHRKLTPEEKMLLDNCYDGFVRSGALLDAAGKERLRQLTEEASMLSLQFSQNLLKENKAFTLHLTDEAQLDGLPDTAREAAALAAKEQEKEGWVFTLDFPITARSATCVVSCIWQRTRSVSTTIRKTISRSVSA